jgi:NAD(P)-dependent dehydrogenase (short-subunit alcohol dehydrogenase family)
LKDKPIDILLNVAGIMSSHEEDALDTCNLSVLQRTFAVNTFGPFLLTQALLPSLLLSKNPRIGIVSSRVGSMGDNSSGGSYAYRASKAAVNSIGKSLSVDLKEKGVLVLLLHPGIVKTNLYLGAGEAKDAVTPDVAASGLWKVFTSKGIDQTGTFWHRDGFELPW